MTLINMEIASNPVNWIKIGLMAAIFLYAAEMVCKIATDNSAPAPNIQP